MQSCVAKEEEKHTNKYNLSSPFTSCQKRAEVMEEGEEGSGGRVRGGSEIGGQSAVQPAPQRHC